jgi:broad specificity phosphatase PhoE
VSKGAAVPVRVLLVTHLLTSATRRGAFPGDEPVETSNVTAPALRDTATIVRGPESRCRQTCTALGWQAEVQDALREWDLGRWRGRTLDEVALDEQPAVAAWLADADAAPHGGESLAALLERIGSWLAGLRAGTTVAVSHPAVVRAAVVTALGVEAPAFWRLDLAPGTVTSLSGRDGRWNVSRLGEALR